MSFRISSIPLNLVDDVPTPPAGTAPTVSIAVTPNDGSAVNLSTVGTIDWWWAAATSGSQVPWDQAVQSSFHTKRMGTLFCRNGFTWRGGAGTHGSVLLGGGRSMSTTASDSSNNLTAINSNKTGYSTTTSGLLNFGFTMSMPISEVTRTLRMYVNPSQVDIQIDAKVFGIDGQEATDSDTIVTGVGSTFNSIIDVSFSGPSNGGRLAVNCFVIAQHAASNNFCVQGFALFEP